MNKEQTTSNRKLKEVLHLYIGGSDVVYDADRKVLGEPSPLFPFYWTNFEYVVDGLTSGKFKLCLRPLSDMTEEEANDCELFMWEEIPELCFGDREKVLKMFIHSTDKYRPGFEPMVRAINWLRKNSFDCDNLIPEGLAIDRTKP